MFKNIIKTIVGYRDNRIDALKLKIQLAQEELALNEARYSSVVINIDSIKAAIFIILKDYYRERDRLRSIIKYRKEFLDHILKGNAPEESTVKSRYEEERKESEEEYASTAEALSHKIPLTKEEEEELKVLWKKLVKLYHPDLVYDDPEKSETFHLLTQLINDAKSRGDIDTLRKIADDPYSFIKEKGWANLSFDPDRDIQSLEKQLNDLLQNNYEIKKILDEVMKSADYELLSLSQKDDSFISSFASKQKNDIEDECVILNKEADALKSKIEKLTRDKKSPL